MAHIRMRGIEWPTLLLLVVVYLLFALAAIWVYPISISGGIVLMGIAGALHSSLTHEILHGHPFKNATLNACLVFPALTLFIPYLRFKDLHLAHHRDENLTDPYDDPETNFLSPLNWAKLSLLRRIILNFNNTLIGRMIVGPLVSQIAFMHSDFLSICRGNRRVLLGWMLHIPAVMVVLFFIFKFSAVSFLHLLCVGYIGLALLKIRTFLEHRAHQLPRGRSVIIEDQGIFSFIFLNNNFHAVHHAYPNVAWYKLPALYFSRKDDFLKRNEGYFYESYRDVFKRYFLKRKDPIAHPFGTNSERK